MGGSTRRRHASRRHAGRRHAGWAATALAALLALGVVPVVDGQVTAVNFSAMALPPHPRLVLTPQRRAALAALVAAPATTPALDDLAYFVNASVAQADALLTAGVFPVVTSATGAPSGRRAQSPTRSTSARRRSSRCPRPSRSSTTARCCTAAACCWTGTRAR